MFTILSKTDGIDKLERHLRLVDPREMALVMKQCARARSESRLGRGGYSKSRTLKREAIFGRRMFLNPELNKIFTHPDEKERERLGKKFLEVYSKFKAVDKL